MSRRETPPADESLDDIDSKLGRIEEILERIVIAVETLARLGAPPAPVPNAPAAPTLEPVAFYYTRDMVRGWRHSEACEASPRRDRCMCGLSALAGAVDRVPGTQRGVFLLRAEVRR